MARDAVRRAKACSLYVQGELFSWGSVGGRSPRELTRAFQARRFRPEGMGRLDQDASHIGEINQEELGQLLFPFTQGVHHG